MPHTNEEMMKRFDERYKRKMLGETLGYDIAHQKDLKHFINQEISDLKKSIREEIEKEIRGEQTIANLFSGKKIIKSKMLPRDEIWVGEGATRSEILSLKSLE